MKQMDYKKKSVLLVVVMALAAGAFAAIIYGKGDAPSTKVVENNKNGSNMKTIQLTKSEFMKRVANLENNPTEWKYLGDRPAIIDFYATWCGPCKAMSPVLEEIAGEYDGKVYIYKVDVDSERELAAMFGIRSIPTLLFIPMGEQPQRVSGALPKSELKQIIGEVLHR